jgi:hypothetical protein
MVCDGITFAPSTLGVTLPKMPCWYDLNLRPTVCQLLPTSVPTPFRKGASPCNFVSEDNMIENNSSGSGICTPRLRGMSPARIFFSIPQ